MKLAILITALFVASAVKGQHPSSAKEIDEYINWVDTTTLKVVLLKKDTASGYLINQTAYATDERKRLLLITTSKGNHPGRVSGHLVKVSRYYFMNKALIKLEEETFNIGRLLRKEFFYFPKGGRSMSRKVYKQHMKNAAELLKGYQ